MGVKDRTQALPNTYFELVKKFPLTHIRDEDHLRQAQKMLDELLQQDLDAGGEAYLDALTDHIEVYETENVSIPDAPPEDVLRELINASGLSQQEVARNVGIAQSTISAILNRTRRLTTRHMAKLAEYFNVSPVVFLPACSSHKPGRACTTHLPQGGMVGARA